MRARGRPAVRRGLRRTCLGVVAALNVAAIPWYRDPSVPPAIVAGLPDWVAVAVACYVAAAAVNALAWLLAADADLPAERDDP